ncbi:hypothetical protein SAMN05444161_2076 [Rhizobiales bacterium GAS191]|jgi:hypothetical protein|nr:hypothetical protein SAMN05519103_01189 [Rhizobiales bacterium GAS113]SEC36858.1 hypothetical protein SAMN05519104_1246 [Rhizobiales bacterium GAS188]SEC90544.1 hypothetical protein SAMN05444161_2076 [Rhizobiales bacterium GAS191]
MRVALATPSVSYACADTGAMMALRPVSLPAKVEMLTPNPRLRRRRLTPPALAAALALPLALALAVSPAHADDYVGYRRIGAWNLAKKTAPTGKRIEMMAVSPRDSEADFFLIMCASATTSLYVSIVTKDPALTVEEPLRLDVGYSFDGTPSHFEMHKVLVDDQAVLRDDDKAHIGALIAALGEASHMIITAGAFARSYDLGGFKQAFEIVDTACRKSGAS